MKKIYFLYFNIFFSIYNIGLAQSNINLEKSFTESTSDQEKFYIYLDLIDKNMYHNIDVTIQALEACQKMIDQGIKLTPSSLLEYNISQIYFEHNNFNPLKSYQLIIESEALLKNEEITENLKSKFDYIKGYTYMEIGDLESAQKTYYEILDKGRETKDTSSIINGLYSLGQLYGDEKDYESAIKYFLQLVEYQKVFTFRASTVSLIDFELSEAYIETEAYDKALTVIERALKYLDQENVDVIRSDFLLNKGLIYLAQNKIEAAESVYKQLEKIDHSLQDKITLENNLSFLADLYTAKKEYTQALEIHKNIIERSEFDAIRKKLNSCAKAHSICKEMGAFEKAYEFLLAFNETKELQNEDKKRQQTAYLKIKFDSEQKEKDNAILAAEIIKKQSQNKLLYALITLFSLFLLILFGAFFQKKRYNLKLRAEVLRRTQDLQKSNFQLTKSNKELDEFNRILSHDLKEPLRSIVGFSKLAKKTIINNPKAKEYLNYVETSGNQLHQLIQDVFAFQNIKKINVPKYNKVILQNILENSIEKIKNLHPTKQIEFRKNDLPEIISDHRILKTVFESVMENGVKYNDQKTVNINVKYQLKDNLHYFEIEDNGIGIAPDFQEKVFGMFKRLNNREDYKGSGLGLSISRKILEKIGGTISILRSKEDQGSTFIINFPVVEKLQEKTNEMVPVS